MTEQGHIESERLQAYLDQELGTDEIKLVESHLVQCSDCEREAERLRDLFQEIESLSDVDQTRDLTPYVLDSIRPRRAPSLSLRVLPLLQAVSTMILLGLLWPVIWSNLLQLELALSTGNILTWIENMADLIQSGSADFINRAGGWLESALARFEFHSPNWPSSAWWLVLAVVFVVWLIGNGLLLRNAERRSNRS